MQVASLANRRRISQAGDGVRWLAACDFGQERSCRHTAFGMPDHRFDARRSVSNQIIDQRRFGHRRPMLLGHLRPHCIQFDPSRVEDVRIVRLPNLF